MSLMGRLNFENKTENRRNLESKLEKRKEDFVRNNLLSDEFIEFVQKNKKPFDTLMSYINVQSWRLRQNLRF